ncbi:MAG: hypothetical protein AB7T63_10930 [Planctomycetota bacterium]
MKRGVVSFLALAALSAATLPFLISCGSGGGGQRTLPRIDAIAATRDDAVLIFRDALHKSYGDVADVALTSASGVDRPTGVARVGNRLFVSCYDSSRIIFFDDYGGLVSGDSYDGSLSISQPNRLFEHDGDLYAVSQGSHAVYVWRGAETIGSGASPDAMLTGSMSYPKDVCVADDMVFVAGYNSDTVPIWAGAASLSGTVGPDVVLDLTGSLLRQPIRVAVQDGTLYVANRDNAVYLFRNASLAYDGAPPDVVLGGPSDVDGPRRPLITNDRLFVPSRYEDKGMSIFHDPASLTNGAIPDAEIVEPWTEIYAADLHRNVLFGFAGQDGDDLFFAYFDARNIQTGQEPDLALWDPRVLYERVIEILLVDSPPVVMLP